jgi:SAM-dependent methyltransferase
VSQPDAAQAPPGGNERTWEKVWENPIEDYHWDYLGQVILDALLDEAGAPAGRSYLEVGSGSGRISARLASLGGRTTLLDFEPRALALSRWVAEGQGVTHVAYLQGSMFEIPSAERYDVVWNAGVIEHYPFERQVLALRQMGARLAPGGLLVTLNPYAGSLLHTFGKWLITRFVEYPFGEEVPIQSCAEMAREASLSLVKEYSIGFVVLFPGALKRLMLLPGGRLLGPLFRGVNALLVALDRGPAGPALRRVDRALSRWLGGYLIVSVMRHG